ncbi:MAG: acyl-CoA carboxylase subunit beta [Myxococcales bacterium]|nr:acyl-CoA carboxylase subunit beta [Myxococcales bacterium]
MTTLTSTLRATTDGFRANADRMTELLEEVRGLEAQVRKTSASKRAKFEARGKLLPRERVARLLDRGSPFLELCTLAGLGMHDDDGKKTVMGGGFIAGVGVVQGKRVVVSANDAAIKGGTVAPLGLKKALRVQQIAMRQKLPMISLVESGGANLQYQSEIFIDGGRTFANQARMSAAGIPQIAVVHGSSTAGGAYLPGMSDYVVLVRDQSKIFLAGPPLVKAAMGQDATDEELGGAELHGTVTGLGEYLAEDDEHALAVARDLMGMIRWDAADGTVRDQEPRAPLLDPQELLGVVSANPREPWDVREVVARIVDGSQFLEFKAAYATDTVCGHAHIDGYCVGIVGNNGPIQPRGSVKAAQFMQLCDQSGTPLLFLQNTTGYMVGTTAEREGAIKHGSKMIQAVANVRVPRITVVLGGSYGAGNYGMCGRGFDPDFIFSWPTARTAVMGGEQAAGVMAIVLAQKIERSGGKVNHEDIANFTAPLRDQLDAEAHVLFGTARLFDDGVIDPRDTREVVATCLDAAIAARRRELRPNAFGVARM